MQSDYPSARLTQLQQAISQKPFLYLAESIHVTCSFGVAWIALHTVNVEDMIHRADEALYDAKASGRNRIVFYAQSSQSDRHDVSVPIEARKAIDD